MTDVDKKDKPTNYSETTDSVFKTSALEGAIIHVKVNAKSNVCRILNEFPKTCKSADILKAPILADLSLRQMTFLLRFRQTDVLF
jgi:hypothetical protein